MHDLGEVRNRYGGEILFQPDGVNILAKSIDPIEVRMRIGMVFQKPNPFPSRSSRTLRTGCVCVGSATGARWPTRSSRR